MIEAYKVQRSAELSIEFWETPASSQSASASGLTKRAEQKEVIDLVDEVSEEELKNRKDVIKPVTFGHEPMALTNSESDSDTKEVVRKLLERLKHIKFTEFFKLTRGNK